MPGIGGKERKYMSSTTNYTDAPEDIEQSLDKAIVISDFLPSPAELVRKTEKEKITIAIDKQSLASFKRYAKAHDTKYQTMINRVVSSYADKFLTK